MKRTSSPRGIAWNALEQLTAIVQESASDQERRHGLELAEAVGQLAREAILAAAVRDHAGNLFRAAEQIGVPHRTALHWAQRSPALRRELDRIRQAVDRPPSTTQAIARRAKRRKTG